MLNYFQPSDQGLIDNRPCGLRGIVQYPRVLKCEDPFHALAIIEEMLDADEGVTEEVERQYKNAANDLSTDVADVIERLEGGFGLEDVITRLRAIEKELGILATGEFI